MALGESFSFQGSTHIRVTTGPGGGKSMLLIFGTKRYLETKRQSTATVCSWCHNRSFYRFVQERRWLMYLFFLPVFPYHASDYLQCSSCGFCINLSRKDLRAARRGMLRLSEDGQLIREAL